MCVCVCTWHLAGVFLFNHSTQPSPHQNHIYKHINLYIYMAPVASLMHNACPKGT